MQGDVSPDRSPQEPHSTQQNPSKASIRRLIRAVLLEANDEWQLQHRYMQVEAMTELTAPAAGSEPAQISPQAV